MDNVPVIIPEMGGVLGNVPSYNVLLILPRFYSGHIQSIVTLILLITDKYACY